jgi:tetratricopeptide (TPR) repeat protein
MNKKDYINARTYLQESLGLYRTLGFSKGVVGISLRLGEIAQYTGDYDLANACLLEVSEIYHKFGYSHEWLKATLGEMALYQGKYQEARTYLEEYLSWVREHGSYNQFVTFKLGCTALRQGDQAYARLLFKEILDTNLLWGETIGKVCGLEGFVRLAVAQGELERAARLFAYTDTTRQTIHAMRTPIEHADIDRDIATIRAHIDEATFDAAQEAGRAMSMDENPDKRHTWTTERLWRAYAQLEHDRVRGAGERRVLADLVSLVRHAVALDDELPPYPARVAARYHAWLNAQEAGGRAFTPEQR